MSTHNVRPKWWQLYLTFPFLIALFILDDRLKISVRGHQALQIGIILLFYGFVSLWLKANESALSKMGQAQNHKTFTVIQIPPYRLPDRPMLHLPDLEIKGVLSDAFEMDYIDAEFLPSDEVPQELDKE